MATVPLGMISSAGSMHRPRGRIDDNVTQMQDNLEAGIQELEQSVSGSSNLRLMAKMFGVTVVFLIFFIVFLA